MTIVRGPRHEHDFTILANSVLRDARLSFKARGMLAFGLSMPPQYRMTRAELAAASPGEGDKSVQNGLAELSNAGYLVRRRLRRLDGSFCWESVLYEIPQDTSTTDDHTAPATDGERSLAATRGNAAKPQVAPVSVPHSVVNAHPKRSTSDEELEELPPPYSPPSSSNGRSEHQAPVSASPTSERSAPIGSSPKDQPRPDAFAAFWAVYPQRIAKDAAKKAWPGAVKRAGSPDVVLAGAQRYRDDPNRDACFTARPATWLNAGRWDDDPLPPRPTRPMTNHERNEEVLRRAARGQLRPSWPIVQPGHGVIEVDGR